jgi:signal transduction histidine kinase
MVSLHRGVGRYVLETGGEAADRDEVVAGIGRLRGYVSQYVSLPSYPGERALLRELLASIDAVVATSHEILAARATEPDKARRLFSHQLALEVSRAEELLLQNARLNAEEIEYFTRRIEAIRGGSSRVAVVLNALCVLLALLLTLLVVRTMRRKQAIEARHAAVLLERAYEMEVFAGRVAHDILSPLQATTLSLEQLTRFDDASVSRLAGRAERGVAKVLATVDGLLAFARAGARAGDGEVSDVAQVTAEAVSGMVEIAAVAGVSLELKTPDSVCQVHASRGVLLSIVNNLVQNAIKYIGDGPNKQVLVTVGRFGGVVRIEVCDTGPGIPPDLQQRIFEPYFRLATGGTGLGLGLPTVKRLSEAHGGSVGVSSQPGAGACLWVELPGA